MIYIYQIIGVTKDYANVCFSIKKMDGFDQYINNDMDGDDMLASTFVFKKMPGDKKIIFLWPASLDSGIDNFKNRLKNNGLNEDNYEIIIMPSFGTYNNKYYDFYPQEIMLFIFLDMLKRINADDILLLDINTGLNEYVNLLIDAAANLFVALWLFNINNEKSLRIYKIISEPVLKGSKKVSIYIQSLNKKAFFLVPYKKEFKIASVMEMNDDLKMSFEFKFKHKRNYRNLINNVIIIYNSIDMNTLSVLKESYNKLFSDSVFYDLKCSIKELIDNFSDLLNNMDGGRNIKILNVNEIINFILTLYLYCGFFKLFKDKIHLEKLDDYLELGNLIYNNKKINLPQNIRFLTRDIQEFKEMANNNVSSYYNKEDPEFNNESDKNGHGDMERNFFAHSGLDRESVDIKGDKIIYKSDTDDKKAETHRKWLLKLSK
ncbi:TM1812 family CRISPR-associated protein [Picrophilus oshimae]|uniref:CRISPR-associated protein Csx1 n=1 Tax=Picrophilus torridus (strain ATCC 700027 / DSM 9790 / JCM 10055 / NBRC 100828 / KAW 2/3) TaxID=1122961 RepID=A0A8G2L7W0_PICTO|nr:hypothetical protein [Picrophilus oshimae]SMD31435.1 CRISPR-associated protein Csx1 [Picrophilus oshimae DSM 9789]